MDLVFLDFTPMRYLTIKHNGTYSKSPRIVICNGSCLCIRFESSCIAVKSLKLTYPHVMIHGSCRAFKYAWI